MTKVNYFTYKNEGDEISSDNVAYATSKKHALEIFGNRSEEVTGTIREMNMKGEVVNLFDIKELFDIRTRDKQIWKNLDNTRKVKKQAE